MAELASLNPKTWDPLQDLPNLTGKVAVVTGSSTGVGLGTVKFLALKGAKVYMAARSEEKSKQAIDDLRSENPEIGETQISWLKLDLSDVRRIDETVAQLKTKEAKIDILVNNAAAPGTSSDSSRLSSGWEPHIGIDHAGHFMLTNRLLPLLEAATREPNADVRIVTVSSNASFVFLPSSYEPNFDKSHVLENPVPYISASWAYGLSHLFKVDMFTYSVAKLANAMFAQDLQRRLLERGLPIISLHLNPGGVYTAASDIFRFGIRSIARGTFLTPDQGAKNSVFAAASPSVRQHQQVFGGQYLEPVGRVATHHPALKKEFLVKGLWSNTQEAVNKNLKGSGLQPLSDW